ncbi:venom serine carboxypeptidase-like [Papilio machaon]|uniref:venom serine carboxypeptidase-like n=1 Tax=Papilio machaon TaxID=76193 RepID=UPI001E664A7F|nr:venom serine carboxypeptidase-like [Papilio machaon]
MYSKMYLIKILITYILCALLTSVNCKVVLSREKITELLNSIDPLKIKVTIHNNEEIIELHKRNKTVTKYSNEINVEDNEVNVEDNKPKNDITVKLKTKVNNTKEANNETEHLEPLILTPFIEQGRIDEAKNASLVNPEMFLGFTSYSGYLTVNKTYNSNMFFWFFPIVDKPIGESPWIIWLQGGPGASSMTGLFEEIGPLKMGAKLQLERNPYTWLQNHSLVFFDNPVGTGFSFTDDKRGYVRDMPTYSRQLYTAFHQFVQMFPELKEAPLYIAGESYAGKYVPALGLEIHNRIHLPEHRVNLKGLMIGNAYVDPAVIPRTVRPFYNFGLIEQEQVEMLRPLSNAVAEQVAAKNGALAKNKWINLISLLLMLSHQSHAYNFLHNDLGVGRYVKFLNQTDIQKAIHVRRTNFNFVNMTVNFHLASDFLSSSKPHFETLLEHYRVLAYCGQLDLMMPCVTTSENYRTWKWNEKEKFLNATRLPYLYLHKRAGYHKTGGGLTEVVFMGAGHMVPMDVPAPARDLITRWTHNKELSASFPLLERSFITGFIANNSAIYL